MLKIIFVALYFNFDQRNEIIKHRVSKLNGCGSKQKNSNKTRNFRDLEVKYKNKLKFIAKISLALSIISFNICNEKNRSYNDISIKENVYVVAIKLLIYMSC